MPDPICDHFGQCGGCTLQHRSLADLANHKREELANALRSYELATQIHPTLQAPLSSRRRATFNARVIGGQVKLGFHAARSHQLIDVHMCPVMRPAITNALPQLRKIAAHLNPRKPLRLAVTDCDGGLDVAVTSPAEPSEGARLALMNLTRSGTIARLSVNDELITARVKPVVMFGDIAVTPPPGAFMQAVEVIQNRMLDLVIRHLAGAKSVCDLFCGTGTFTLPLLRRAKTHAVEFDADALEALTHAANRMTARKALATERRDLFRRPLLRRELDAFDAVVFDPPRAGAEAQCRQLAGAKVKRIAAISCNPQTLARDLRILTDSGYTLLEATPLDQFLYSRHVEVVALLERK